MVMISWQARISPTGDAYEGKFVNSVILNGILYFNVAGSPMGGQTETNGIRAIDLHTGKELWFRNNTSYPLAKVFYFNGFNYDGVFQYLWDASGPDLERVRSLHWRMGRTQ